MFFYHHSHNPFCRTPFGAVRQGAEVILRAVSAEPVTLRLWDGKEHLLPMEKTDTVLPCRVPGLDDPLYGAAPREVPDEPCGVYEVRLDENYTARTGLLWYFFVTESGCRFAAADALGGLCVPHADGTPLHSQQITVFDRDFDTPRWMHRAVMYQIFPDRFFDGRGGALLKSPRTAGPSVLIHTDKSEMPCVIPNGDGADGIETNDFYGGNLAGIEQKLSFLADMGVTVLYLNPIFEAASNHRYDTADYEKIDPFLGDEAAFVSLCRTARERYGIRVVLDGVFSHTGEDSRYFNKYGRYPEIGAFQRADSPYAPWYRFEKDTGKYECWWGVKSLPCVDELSPGYLDYIVTGENAVVSRWLRRGASGWRLDVADELPDEFIEKLRERVKKEDPDAAVIGEVWEDATTKISYGQMRTYALGRGLDSVMNYPLRDALIAFLLGEGDSTTLKRALDAQREHYPTPMVYALMNLMGTHDRSRILNILGECDRTDLPRVKQREIRMSDSQRQLGKKRLLAMLDAICALPGMPCVYYGDEAGVEGMRDPLCRAFYPWGREDAELLEDFRQRLRFRREHPVLADGFVSLLCPDPDTLLIRRFYRDGKNVFGENAAGEALCVAVRR